MVFTPIDEPWDIDINPKTKSIIYFSEDFYVGDPPAIYYPTSKHPTSAKASNTCFKTPLGYALYAIFVGKKLLGR